MMLKFSDGCLCVLVISCFLLCGVVSSPCCWFCKFGCTQWERFSGQRPERQRSGVIWIFKQFWHENQFDILHLNLCHLKQSDTKAVFFLYFFFLNLHTWHIHAYVFGLESTRLYEQTGNSVDWRLFVVVVVVETSARKYYLEFNTTDGKKKAEIIFLQKWGAMGNRL